MYLFCGSTCDILIKFPHMCMKLQTIENKSRFDLGCVDSKNVELQLPDKDNIIG